MLMKRSPVIAALIAAATGCGDGIAAPPAGLPHSVATRSCGPTDGPAVAIYLTRIPMDEVSPPPSPSVVISILAPVTQIEGRGWDVSQDSQTGSAVWIDNANAFQSASYGGVIIRAVLADTTIEGSVDLVFPDAGRVRGGFRAKWISSSFRCG